MVLARRRADIEWRGTLDEGEGGFTVGDWMLGELPVSWIERTSRIEGSTSPEELMAASHASCYAMALSLVLEQRGTPSERLHVSAECTLDTVGESFKITTMELEVRGKIPNLDDDGLREAAKRAEEICPVSNALRGNVEITVDAILEKE